MQTPRQKRFQELFLSKLSNAYLRQAEEDRLGIGWIQQRAKQAYQKLQDEPKAQSTCACGSSVSEEKALTPPTREEFEALAKRLDEQLEIMNGITARFDNDFQNIWRAFNDLIKIR